MMYFKFRFAELSNHHPDNNPGYLLYLKEYASDSCLMLFRRERCGQLSVFLVTFVLYLNYFSK